LILTSGFLCQPIDGYLDGRVSVYLQPDCDLVRFLAAPVKLR